jgi:hypothetical protein
VVSQLDWPRDPLQRLETGAGPAHGHSTVAKQSAEDRLMTVTAGDEVA